MGTGVSDRGQGLLPLCSAASVKDLSTHLSQVSGVKQRKAESVEGQANKNDLCISVDERKGESDIKISVTISAVARMDTGRGE